MSRLLLGFVITLTIIILLQDSLLGNKRRRVEGFDTVNENSKLPPQRVVQQNKRASEESAEVVDPILKNEGNANVPPQAKTNYAKPSDGSNTDQSEQILESYESLGGSVGSPYKADSNLSYADGTSEPATFPDPGKGSREGKEISSETAFSAADANNLFADNLRQTQFGETEKNPSKDLLPQITVSDMADAFPVHDNIEMSQEDLIDLAAQCQGISTIMTTSTNKARDIRGNIAPPRVNTGPWMQSSVDGTVDTKGLCA